MKPINILNRRLILILILLFLMISNVKADDYRLFSGGIGIRVGFINSGTITLTSRISGEKIGEYETTPKMSYGIFFDIPARGSVGMFLGINIHEISYESFQNKVLNVEIGLKRLIYNNQGELAFRPGISIGYAYVSEIAAIQKANLLTVTFLGEAVFLTNSKYGILLDLSIIYSPYGRDKRYEISTSPTFIFRSGVIF